MLYWRGRWKKIIALKSSEHKGNRKRRMRKRKNKASIDEISPGLLIKQKEGEKNAAKKPKKTNKSKRKTKVKVEIKTEIKLPKPPKKKKLKQ